MLKAACRNGWLERAAVMMETLLGFKRAGADGMLTYFAQDAATWLAEPAAAEPAWSEPGSAHGLGVVGIDRYALFGHPVAA